VVGDDPRRGVVLARVDDVADARRAAVGPDLAEVVGARAWYSSLEASVRWSALTNWS
jgi:hypothetical protein